MINNGQLKSECSVVRHKIRKLPSTVSGRGQKPHGIQGTPSKQSAAMSRVSLQPDGGTPVSSTARPARNPKSMVFVLNSDVRRDLPAAMTKLGKPADDV